MSLTPLPEIGEPNPPPHALCVAVSERTAKFIRSFRLRKAAIGVLVLLFGFIAFLLLVLAAHQFNVGLGKIFALSLSAFSILAIGGLILIPRELELSTLGPSRNAKGGINLWETTKKIFLILPNTTRHIISGALIVLGQTRNDPLAEFSAWILLALTPAHYSPPRFTPAHLLKAVSPDAKNTDAQKDDTTEENIWLSLSGIKSAGPFELPFELQITIGALKSKNLIELSTSTYPPKIRITPKGTALLSGE